MQGLIYIITNKVNSKVYIGQTTQSLRQRKAEHLSRLEAGQRQHKLYLAMRKHGVENFEFSELCCVFDEKHLDEIEVQFIKEYNSYNRGYNSSEGGGSTSPETRAKLSAIFKGRKIPWMYKIVASRKANGRGRQKECVPRGAAHSKSKSYLVRTPLNTDVRIDGLRQFCRDNDLSHNLLIATIQGKQTHHKGYVLLKRFNDQLERA